MFQNLTSFLFQGAFYTTSLSNIISLPNIMSYQKINASKNGRFQEKYFIDAMQRKTGA